MRAECDEPLFQTPFSGRSPSGEGGDEWVNLTVYHTNQLNYSMGDIADMNTADALGDLEFTIRAKQVVRSVQTCAAPAGA